MRFTRFIFPTVLVLVLFGMSWVVIENYRNVQKLNEQGKPAVTVATPLAGKDGSDGRSAYQIWLDNGHRGSEREFLNWIRGDDGFSGEPGVDGRDGQDGENGKDGKNGADGLSIKGDKGDKGDTGATGASGMNGTNGKTPELACVMRWDTDLPTVTRYFVAWKYTDATTWNNLYKIPSQQRPDTGCVDLRQ